MKLNRFWIVFEETRKGRYVATLSVPAQSIKEAWVNEVSSKGKSIEEAFHNVLDAYNKSLKESGSKLVK